MNELKSDARGNKEKILIGQDYLPISKAANKKNSIKNILEHPCMNAGCSLVKRIFTRKIKSIFSNSQMNPIAL